MRTPVLVFDLDGTLYTADHAGRAYATALSASMATTDRTRYLDLFDAFLAKRLPPPAGTHDPWEVAVRLAYGPPARPADFPDAFAAARSALHALPDAMIAPAGLKAFLTWAQDHSTIIVATNASHEAAEETLRRIELRHLVAQVFTDVGKPKRLPTLLQSIAATANTTSSELLVCGDNYRIDIEPALSLGCTTVELNPYDFYAPSLSTLQVPSMEDAIGFLRTWVATRSQHADPGIDTSSN